MPVLFSYLFEGFDLNRQATKGYEFNWSMQGFTHFEKALLWSRENLFVIMLSKRWFKQLVNLCLWTHLTIARLWRSNCLSRACAELESTRDG